MAVERLIIEVSESGTRRVRKEVEGVGEAAAKTDRRVGGLRTALGALVPVLSAGAVLRQVDAYTNLQNRLRLVTNGTEELRQVTEGLFAVADRSRSSVESTIELYSRFAQNTRDLNLGQEQLLRITETVTKAVRISGASASEAVGGLRQLGQALSGGLRGDELTSVLENLPRVARLIADQLGVQVGALRTVAAQGKITTEVLIEAFKNAGAQIDEEFAKLVPTVSESLTRLSNKTLEIFGKLNEDADFSANFSDAVDVVIQALKNLINFLNITIAGFKILKIEADLAFDNPILGRKVLGEVDLKGFVKPNRAKELGNENELLNERNRLLRVFRGEVDDFLADAGRADVFADSEKDFARVERNLQRALKVAADLNRELSTGPLKNNEASAQSVIRRLDRGGIALVEFNRRLDQQLRIAKADPQDAARIQSRVAAEQTLISQGVNINREDARETLERSDAVNEEIRLLNIRAGLLESLKTPEQQRAERLKELNQLLSSGLITQDQYNKGLKTYVDGVTQATSATRSFFDALLNVNTSAAAVAGQVGDQLKNAISSASGALAEFAVNGAKNVDELRNALSETLKQLSQQILQTIIQALAFRAISAGASGLGSLFDFKLTPQARAAGGRAERGRPIFTGEHGRELFIPDQPGRIVPAGESRGMLAPELKVQVINVRDEDEVISALDDPRARQKILNIQRRGRRG